MPETAQAAGSGILSASGCLETGSGEFQPFGPAGEVSLHPQVVLFHHQFVLRRL